MPVSGRSIHIYLPHGEPRGVRIAEFTTRIVQATAFPRSKLAEALQRHEVSRVGVYFLFGHEETEVDDRPIVYVGEAEDCSVRLQQHHVDSDKDFWQTAVAITSSTARFTKAHIRMLEFLSIQKVRLANRYVCKNGNCGIEPHVPEAMLAEVHEIFETMEVLLSALGYPVFDPLGFDRLRSTKDNLLWSTSPNVSLVQQRTEDKRYYYRGDGFSAELLYTEDGYVVLKGSQLRSELRVSGKDQASKREKLLKEGVLVQTDKGLVFDRDYAFGTPSAAAVLVSGASVNGWDCWKDVSGRTLNDDRRQTSVTPSPD